MIDLTIYILFFVLSGFAFFSIKQDFFERKVSNKLTFSLFIFAFIYFVYSFWNYFMFSYSENLWVDLGFIFWAFLVSFFVFYKGIWGAADGKIFLAILLILISFIHSVGVLRWILNLFFLYSLVLIILGLYKSDIKTQYKVLKKLDYLDSALVILVVFVILDIIMAFYLVDKSNVIVMILFFVVLFMFMYKVKKYLKKHFRNMFKDVKFMVFAILFMWNFLYGGMGIFVLKFGFVMFIKTLISFVSVLVDNVRNLDGSKYESPFSLYLFVTAIFTLVVNKSFVEILALFFY